MLRVKLWSSYGSTSPILALSAWLAVVAFQLIGTPQHLAAALGPVRVISKTGPASSVPSAPLPADQHELVIGAVQVPASPADRAAALGLLERARQNADLHMPGTPPFVLTASFTAAGNVPETGSGQIVETWASRQRWRYTQALAGYSEVRIGSNGLIHSSTPRAPVPIRVQMIRNAIFAPVAPYGSASNIRVAAAQWGNRPVTCILLARSTDPVTPPGRHWEETEYCIDSASGLLQIYSVAPGAYVVYGYAQNEQFHGRLVPDRVTGYLAGEQVFDARISIADLGVTDAAQFTPTPEMGMTPPLAHAIRFPLGVPSASVSDTAKPVMVHVSVDKTGQLLVAEVSAAADPALAPAALDAIRKFNFGNAGVQREAYVNVRFVPAR